MERASKYEPSDWWVLSQFKISRQKGRAAGVRAPSHPSTRLSPFLSLSPSPSPSLSPSLSLSLSPSLSLRHFLTASRSHSLTQDRCNRRLPRAPATSHGSLHQDVREDCRTVGTACFISLGARAASQQQADREPIADRQCSSYRMLVMLMIMLPVRVKADVLREHLQRRERLADAGCSRDRAERRPQAKAAVRPWADSELAINLQRSNATHGEDDAASKRSRRQSSDAREPAMAPNKCRADRRPRARAAAVQSGGKAPAVLGGWWKRVGTPPPRPLLGPPPEREGFSVGPELSSGGGEGWGGRRRPRRGRESSPAVRRAAGRAMDGCRETLMEARSDTDVL